MDNRVVITGTGLVSSLGLTPRDTWDALLAGKSGIRPIEGFDARGFECPRAAQVPGLGPSELNIHPRDSRIMDRHSYMLLKCSRDAVREARLDSGAVAADDIGFFAGMGMVDYNIEDLLPAVTPSLDKGGALDYDRFFSGAYREIHPLWPLSMLNNIGFCQAAIDLGIRGENTTFSPHADSGVHAVIEAYHTLLEGKAEAVLAGGVSEKVSPLSMARALWSGLLNTSDRGHDAPCRPFGRDRSGTILGEGCGILSLELQSSAGKRNVSPLAAVTGYGASCELSADAHCPTPQAMSLSMEQAIAGAALEPSDIDLIIAHGDGTLKGDGHEIEAIHRTFSPVIDRMVVFSSKGALGHLLAGAPAVDAVLAVCMMTQGIVPSASLLPPHDESIKFTMAGDTPRSLRPRRILINSRSSEGQCASLIIESVK
ncbi:MAG: hypothetical protein JSU90_04560 [Nitrospiraceae bacterium]|nr:MAG: hypothetical protein JSU90_04560 [Nitrospiraceae bacterium]